MKFMTSGEVASRLGVSVTTVRNYESRKLLVPDMVYPSGRRAYSEETVNDFLAKIKVGGIEKDGTD